MYEVKISGESIAELKKNIVNLATEFEETQAPLANVVQAAPVQAAPVQAAPVAKKKVAKKKVAKRPATLVEQQAAKAPVPEVIEAKVAPVKVAPVTKEAALNILKDVNGKRGLPMAKELLSKYKAIRFGDVKEADYAAFLADGTEMLNE